jgi:PAS domain S-box-containing protein
MWSSKKSDLLNTIDWSNTSLGPISEWPETLEFSTRTIINSPIPMMILWGEESIAIYNDAFADFIGNKHPDLFGKPFQELWPELDDLSSEVINTCFYNCSSKSYINHRIKVFVNNKNKNLWVNIHCSPITDERKISVGILMVFIDQSEKVLSEQSRKKSEELFEVAMDAAGMMGIWEWDLRTDLIYSDPRLASLFSIDPNKFKFGTFASEYFEKVHLDDVELVKANIKKAIEKREKFSMEYRLMQKDGSIRWILSRAKCNYHANGKPVRLVGVAVEITEQKET